MKNFKTLKNYHRMSDQYYEIFNFTDENFPEDFPHTHDYYEIYLSLAQKLDYIVEGTLYSLKEKDMLFIPPQQTHFRKINQIEPKSSRIVIRLSREFMDELAKIDEDIYYAFKTCTEQNNNLVRLYSATIQSLYAGILLLLDEENSEKYQKNLYRYTTMASLLVHINRSIYFQGSFELSTQTESVIDDVVQYIIRNATRNLPLEEIAAEFHMSISHLAHLFKMRMGVSIYSYIIQRRMILDQQ